VDNRLQAKLLTESLKLEASSLPCSLLKPLFLCGLVCFVYLTELVPSLDLSLFQLDQTFIVVIDWFISSDKDGC
jgi:hypothetical protein